MNITLKDIEKNIEPLGGKTVYNKDFIFDLLAAYGRSQGNITRLRNGQLNVADDPENEVAQKGVVYFKPSAQVNAENLYLIIDDLKSSPTVVRYSTRFIVVTDYQNLLAVDTKTGETLDIKISDIDRHYAFFLPWAGMEKAQFISENHADVKAAEKMAKLFDSLVRRNGYKTASDWHTLNTFFTRLLFCLFAEDVNIFRKNQFTNAIASYTQKDGSDLRVFLTDLFKSLDDERKEKYPSHFSEFPYVNGRLFRESTLIPEFNKQSRDLLIESASKLDWSGINPDIFGSMFQAVVRPGKRTGLGQHYTSVPNIMKVIEPLFLDELKEEFDKAYNDKKKLKRLLDRMSKIKVFDPACGSGNFLIIAYKELRKLEHAILERMGELSSGTQQVLFGSIIDIKNFYGIEIDDFACEVAVLSLWIAKHQMNIEFAEKFGIDIPLIPLKEAGNIVHGNATRIDWNEACPSESHEEVYLIGNPPYAGFNERKNEQKGDMDFIFKSLGHFQRLDYVACWLEKGSEYISQRENAKVAFVTTNSISQGEQVSLLWPRIFSKQLEIIFAHTSFKWGNNARGNAGVFCTIIALGRVTNSKKTIYSNTVSSVVDSINPYLVEGGRTIINARTNQISDLPVMQLGSSGIDGGFLILEKTEKNTLLTDYPQAAKFIKRYIGGSDFLRGNERYCLWIDDDKVQEAQSIPYIKDRIDKCRNFRLHAGRDARKAASVPHRFFYRKYKETQAMVLPMTSSERRLYIPVGFVQKGTVLSNGVFTVYDAKPFMLGILSSRMHMIWLKAVSGKLKADIRYSSTIAYNNFPVPTLNEREKMPLEEKAFVILDTRENHPEKTLADMYDPDKMPDDLLIAHQELDEVVDKIYRKKPFQNDEERLAHLFNLYEIMIAKEK